MASGPGFPSVFAASTRLVLCKRDFVIPGLSKILHMPCPLVAQPHVQIMPMSHFNQYLHLGMKTSVNATGVVPQHAKTCSRSGLLTPGIGTQYNELNQDSGWNKYTDRHHKMDTGLVPLLKSEHQFPNLNNKSTGCTPASFQQQQQQRKLGQSRERQRTNIHTSAQSFIHIHRILTLNFCAFHGCVRKTIYTYIFLKFILVHE